MESKNLQWSDELRKEVREALAKSNLADVMKKAGILAKGNFEVQINLVDTTNKPTNTSLTPEKISRASSRCVYVYYAPCSQCTKDGGTPLSNNSECWCEFCV